MDKKFYWIILIDLFLLFQFCFLVIEVIREGHSWLWAVSGGLLLILVNLYIYYSEG